MVMELLLQYQDAAIDRRGRRGLRYNYFVTLAARSYQA